MSKEELEAMSDVELLIYITNNTCSKYDTCFKCPLFNMNCGPGNLTERDRERIIEVLEGR